MSKGESESWGWSSLQAFNITKNYQKSYKVSLVGNFINWQDTQSISVTWDDSKNLKVL